MVPTVAAPSFSAQVRSLGTAFWVANGIEAGERLAFWGVRAVLPVFLVDGASGLGLTYKEKGFILMVWAVVQCLVPMVSGGYTDAYGYRKSLFVALGLNTLGYGVMAQASGFATMLMAAVLVATGTAIFKPPVQGIVASSVDERTSGVGFGIFYWVVNVGGFVGPILASWARGNDQHPTWSLVFYGAALVSVLNLGFAALFAREPRLSRGGPPSSPLAVLGTTFSILWRDRGFLRFLLLFSGFWFLFMQMWDLLPNFIDEWVDTRDVGALLQALLGDLAAGWTTSDGAAKPEVLINVDAAAILLLVVPLSWAFSRLPMMVSLVAGMVVSGLALVGAGSTRSGLFCAAMVFAFAVGEILCSPKFSEYIGVRAPPDRKALYMGYSNIPFAIGWAAGNGISGWLYDALASRTLLARRHLVEALGLDRGEVEALPASDVLPRLARALEVPDQDAVQVLWDTYDPWRVWLVLGAVGALSLGGILWNQWTSREST